MTVLLPAVVPVALIIIIGAIAHRYFSLDSLGKSLLATTIFGNVGNLGLPLNSFAFGDEGLERAIICLITSAILLFGVIPAILQGKGWSYGIRMTLKLPLFWAMIAGIMFNFLQVEFPYRLDVGSNPARPQLSR